MSFTSRCIALLGLLLLFTACGERGGAGNDEILRKRLPEIAANMGRAKALTLDLTMVASQPDKDRVIFTVSAWITPDDSLRVHISKLGYAYLSARIDADGSVIAHQMVDKFAVESSLDELKQAALSIDAERREERGEDATDSASHSIDLFAELRLLLHEFTRGPIPYADTYAFSSIYKDAFVCELPDGNHCHFRISPDQRGVTEKWLHNADDQAMLHIDYGRYQEFDGMYRATKMAIAVEEHDGEYKVRLKRFDSVPAISPDHMQVSIPDSSEMLDAKGFILRLIDEDQHDEQSEQ